MSPSLSRRAWLRQAALYTASPMALNLLAMQQAAAASTSSYKALVCVFLFGGNDACNTVLPLDAASWAAYEAARGGGSDPVALAAPGTPARPGAASVNARLGGVLPLEPVTALPGGRQMALHPVLGTVRDLFAARRLAVVSNVGALSQPLTKADWTAGRGSRPGRLFSHNDQQAYWQSFGNEGSTQGWGGAFAARAGASNTHPGLAAIGVNGSAVWTSVAGLPGGQIAGTGPVRLGGAGETLLGSAATRQALLAVAGRQRGNGVLEGDLAALTQRSVSSEALLSAALPGLAAGPWSSAGAKTQAADPLLQCTDPLSGTAAFNPLAGQLQAVARVIAARSALGMGRQVFFVSLSGWDTHDDQPSRHARLLAQLSHGLGYFDRTLSQMGVDQSVTTFTASDFGRSFVSNGDGTDHGWGGHHFVMGGAVRGGELYGSLPTYGPALGNGEFDSTDQIQRGALLPSTGLASYAATLGRWFGLSDSELLALLPALGNWPTTARRLAFLG